MNPPIGKAIDNFELYVLDKDMNPVPVGIPGELYISGIGLARGYHNRPELSAERFLPNPFSIKKGARMYRSGDLVKYLSTGDIEFIGRVDNQVKIRGFRIELGEIESVISNYPGIKESIVIVREDSPGKKQIVSYTVSKNETIDIGELKSFIRTKLPEYMVPVAYVLIDKLPLTPSKKIDYKSLPIPGIADTTIRSEFVEPRTETERIMAEIGKEILGIEKMGVHDNFFELGGHSLLATQFISRIKDSFKKELSLKVLFKNPTIAGLSLELENINLIDESNKRNIEKQSRGSSDLDELVYELVNLSNEEVVAQLNKEKHSGN
jgi:hypothetical protein